MKHLVKESIRQHLGRQIEVFVLDKCRLQQLLKNNPFPTHYPKNRTFIALLGSIPQQDDIEVLRSMPLDDDKLEIRENVCYYYIPVGTSTSKLSNVLIEKKLKVRATSRNINTMLKLMELTQT